VTRLHAVIDVPAGSLATTASFWAAALGWPAGEPWPAHPELRSFEPPDGDSYVHLQRIDGPPRVHLDVEPPSHDATVAQALQLGASLTHSSTSWTAMTSPGALPFCVLDVSSGPAPGPVTVPGGHRVRLVQVCIDSPRSAHAAEVSFWRSLLGGRWVASGSNEFAGTWHDDAGSPLQLLFQQLDEGDGPVRAHLDLGTDDVRAEVARLTALGAEDVAEGRRWHVFRDPAGLSFCSTPNSPEQARHRELA
jgi:hypothetical protein